MRIQMLNIQMHLHLLTSLVIGRPAYGYETNEQTVDIRVQRCSRPVTRCIYSQNFDDILRFLLASVCPLLITLCFDHTL